MLATMHKVKGLEADVVVVSEGINQVIYNKWRYQGKLELPRRDSIIIYGYVAGQGNAYFI